MPQPLGRCLRFWAGCVLTLNPGRESSLLLSDRFMAKMKKGTCHRSHLCRSVSLDTLSSKETSLRDTGDRSWLHWRAWARAKGIPEKDEEGRREPSAQGCSCILCVSGFPFPAGLPSCCFCVATFPCWSTGCSWLWPCRELTWLPKALSQTHLSSQALGAVYFS